MKRRQLAFSAAAAIVVAGIFPASAFAQSIPDRTYMATFGPTECGKLTVGGSSMGYEYGHCSSGKMTEVNYTANSVSRQGSTVRIDQARFEIESIDDKRMVGVWTLGDYSARKIFMKQ